MVIFHEQVHSFANFLLCYQNPLINERFAKIKRHLTA